MAYQILIITPNHEGSVDYVLHLVLARVNFSLKISGNNRFPGTAKQGENIGTSSDERERNSAFFRFHHSTFLATERRIFKTFPPRPGEAIK